VARTQYPSGRSGVAAGWPYNSAITSAEYAWFALGVYKSISETGGTYSLDAALNIGGAAVTFADFNTVFYGITVANASTFSGTVEFDGAVSHYSGVQFLGGSSGAHIAIRYGPYVDVGFNATATLTNYGTTTLNEAVTVSGNTSFTGGSGGAHKTVLIDNYSDVTIAANGTFACHGVSVIDGSCTISASEVRTFSATGHDNYRLLSLGDVNYTMTTSALYDRVDCIPTSTNRTLTLPRGVAIEGWRIMVTNQGTYSVYVVDSGTNYGYVKSNKCAILESLGSAGWHVVAYVPAFNLDTTP
jgi:hypothetical protein